MLKFVRYLLLALIAINTLLFVASEIKEVEKSSISDKLKALLMNYMLEDLKGCENVQKLVENLVPFAMRNPSEACIEACKEDNLKFSGNHKYSGSAVICCCNDKSFAVEGLQDNEKDNQK